MTNTSSKRSHIQRKLQRTLKVYAELSKIAWRLFHIKMFVPVLLGAIGISLQVSTIGSVLLYAKHIHSGEPIKFYSFSYQPEGSIQFLFLFAFFCLVLLLLSSAFNYYYHSITIRYSVFFEKTLIQRALDLVKEANIVIPPHIEGSDNFGATTKIVSGDARYCSRAFLVAIQMVIPVFTCVAGTIILFKTNWLVTLGLFPFMVVYIIFVFRLNQFGVDASKRMESSGQKFRVFLKKNLSGNRQEIDLKKDDEMYEDYLGSYGDVIILSHKSALLNDVLMATTITGILSVLSSIAIIKQSDWSIIAVYLVALRYSVNYLKAFAARVTVLNRFLPQIRRYCDFISSLATPQMKPTKTSYMVSQHQSERKIRLDLGKTMHLYYPQRITKYNAINIIHLIASHHYSHFQTPHVQILNRQDLNPMITSVDWLFINGTAKDDEFIDLKRYEKTFVIQSAQNLPGDESLTSDEMIVINYDLHIIFVGSKSEYAENREQIGSLFTRDIHDKNSDDDFIIDAENESDDGDED